MSPIGIIIAILLCGLIAAIVYRSHCYKTKILGLNGNTVEENLRLLEENDSLREQQNTMKQELEDIERKIGDSTASLSQLNSLLAQTTEEYQKIAEERAQKLQEERMKSLEIEYAAAVADLQDATRRELKDYKMAKNELAKAKSSIQDLQAKQLAYIQMKQREE